MILVVWIALIILTTFYCYFCEQRLFPNKNSLHQGEFCELSESSCSIDETLSATGAGHLHNNMVASLPKNDKRSRKEVRISDGPGFQNPGFGSVVLRVFCSTCI